MLALIVDIIDSKMMYPLLGDPWPADDDELSKFENLLDPETSLIGNCFAQLHHLLTSWLVDGGDRRPMLVLEAVRAPMTDQAFMRFARSQALRTSSSISRRYDLRYSSWPYPLFTL